MNEKERKIVRAAFVAMFCAFVLGFFVGRASVQFPGVVAQEVERKTDTTGRTIKIDTARKQVSPERIMEKRKSPVRIERREIAAKEYDASASGTLGIVQVVDDTTVTTKPFTATTETEFSGGYKLISSYFFPENFTNQRLYIPPDSADYIHEVVEYAVKETVFVEKQENVFITIGKYAAVAALGYVGGRVSQ